ncbi:VOC family protein [Luteimonas sp. 50]|uniref:VOC family protein n=1 Tax=Cognatiluteimonas sedimenti TaxID=2927791 RepID=A0ABT0A6G9_9GAMM|nr:VOC family protein [Lysobacter sedimenti]MCJ0826559.1 VOC family protein [Lysobacter sedimenti]
MSIQSYLFFEGRADEAIAFYRQALDAELLMRLTYADAPGGTAQCPDGSTPPGDKVMHAGLRIGDSEMGLSDGMCSGKPEFKGFSMTLVCADDAEARRRFDALAEGGRVNMPLSESFFATAFGMLVDRFGVDWMVMVPKVPAD